MENEVYFNQNSLIKIDEEGINELKRKAKANANGKYRLCKIGRAHV